MKKIFLLQMKSLALLKYSLPKAICRFNAWYSFWHFSWADKYFLKFVWNLNMLKAILKDKEQSWEAPHFIIYIKTICYCHINKHTDQMRQIKKRSISKPYSYGQRGYNKEPKNRQWEKNSLSSKRNSWEK